MPINERYFKRQIADASAPPARPAKYNVIDRRTGVIVAESLAKKQAMAMARRLNAGEPLPDGDN